MENLGEIKREKYLSRIGVDPKVCVASADSLRMLQRRHLLSIPFENLDIGWKRPIVLDTEKFYKKVVEDGRGGFCYELNGLFNELLKDLGFHTRLVSGRVYGGEKGFGQEFDHMAIVVTLGDDEFLADVGFGDFTYEPLKIDPSEEQVDREGVFIVRPTEHGSFEVEKRHGGTWRPECLFGRNSHGLEEFSGMCEFHQHSPESHFTKGKLCSLLTQAGRKTLTDNNFIVTSNGERTETTVTTESEFYVILDREFGILRPE